MPVGSLDSNGLPRRRLTARKASEFRSAQVPRSPRSDAQTASLTKGSAGRSERRGEGAAGTVPMALGRCNACAFRAGSK